MFNVISLFNLITLDPEDEKVTDGADGKEEKSFNDFVASTQSR